MPVSDPTDGTDAANETNAAQGSVDGWLIRGGTSRGLFVRESALPVDLDDDLIDPLALELFGSPDPIQVDGIGGSHSHTSKLMVVSPSDRPGVSVDYTFGQIAVDRPLVDWGGNCGNLTSAIGTFALLEGMADVTEPTTELVLYNTNTDTRIEQSIPIAGGRPAVDGDYAIDGVAGTGARIDSAFFEPAGGVFGSLFPTGNAADEVTVDGEAIEVSLVDVTNPCVYVRAADLGLEGTELPEALSAMPGLLERLEQVRGTVCEQIGRVGRAADAATESPTVPFIAVVSPPQASDRSDGGRVEAADVDVTARIVTTQTPHHAYAMTGAMCLAAATRLPGTIPSEVARSVPADAPVRIGHPKGRIAVDVTTGGERSVERVTVGRTARPIMDGSVYYRYVDELATLR